MEQQSIVKSLFIIYINYKCLKPSKQIKSINIDIENDGNGS